MKYSHASTLWVTRMIMHILHLSSLLYSMIFRKYIIVTYTYFQRMLNAIFWRWHFQIHFLEMRYWHNDQNQHGDYLGVIENKWEWEILTPIMPAHSVYLIECRSTNRHWNLLDGQCVSSWWPLVRFWYLANCAVIYGLYLDTQLIGFVIL